MKLAKCWIGFVCALAATSAQGGIVFEIPPTLSGGPASDTDFINSSGDPSWQLLADNFSLPIQHFASFIVQPPRPHLRPYLSPFAICYSTFSPRPHEFVLEKLGVS